MKKLLLVVGLVVLFFAQASFAFSFKGNHSNVTWEIEGGADPYAIVNYGNSIDSKIKLYLNWGYTSNSSKIDSFKCLYFDTKDYFNINCEEIGLLVHSKYRAKKENESKVRRFVKLIARDICEDPIITFTQLESATLILGAGYNKANVKCPKTLAKKKRRDEEKRLAKQQQEQQAIIQEQEAKAQEEFDSQQKKMDTCKAYGFEAGTEAFGNCIFKLMELELEYAKLENEKLKLEAQAEQAKLNNQAALANSLATQAQAANQDKALRIQQFGLAMQGLANTLQPAQPTLGPRITCNKTGNLMQCY